MPAPAIVGWLVSGLVSAAGTFFVQALTGVGVAFVINEFGVEPIMQTIQHALDGTPAVLVDMFIYCSGDKAMSTILSALAVAAGTKRIQGVKRT
jgi:ABC-type tungstate transport system substrate-binding protein